MNSEDEERVFKAKVAAVVRQYKRTNRFHGDTPYYRFTRPEPAVGGPSNSFLHSKVLAYSRAGEFELGSLTSARPDGKSFLTGWNNGAITCRKEIKKRYKQRFGKTSENSPAPQDWQEAPQEAPQEQEAWLLIESLPDTDQFGEKELDPSTLASRQMPASRWRQRPTCLKRPGVGGRSSKITTMRQIQPGIGASVAHRRNLTTSLGVLGSDICQVEVVALYVPRGCEESTLDTVAQSLVKLPGMTLAFPGHSKEVEVKDHSCICSSRWHWCTCWRRRR